MGWSPWEVLALAVVFAVAAGGKFADLPGSRAAAAGFGVPTRLSGFVGTSLPFAELAAAIALVAAPRAGGVAALVLLVAFILGVTRAMTRGEQVACHCFGAIHSAPVGWKTLARNVVLALPALAIAIGGGGSIDGGAPLPIALVCGVAASAYVFARRSRPAASAPGPVAARSAPAFAVHDVRSDEVATLDSLLAPGKPLLLLFTDSNCGPCHALLPEATRWQDAFADELSVAVIASGTAEDNRVTATEHGLRSVFIQDARSVSAAFGVTATPSGVLVEPDGTITRAVAPGADAIRTLLPGTPDPRPRELTALDGERIDLARGRRRTLLLFWNPGCGFCRQIEDELRDWEESRRRSDPRFVLVVRGDASTLESLPFDAPIVHDPDGSLMSAFGAPGTPSAVLLERDGSVLGDVAVGGPNALALTTADGMRRRELIGGAGAIVGLASMLSPAAAFGALRKRCPHGHRVCGSRCCPKGATCKSTRVRGKLVKKCVCPKGRRACGKSCVSLTSDPKNCGACGKTCAAGQTCQAGTCVGGAQQQPGSTEPAAPTCTDGIKNGTETDIDCGGPSCPKCADGKGCSTGGDCDSGVCTGGVCSQPAATCSDGKKNGGETDVDCGGPQCPACANGKACVAGTDCTSGHCAGGVCRECSADSDCPQGPAGDCHKAVCASGVCGFVVDNTDTPASSGNDCQTAACVSGAPALQNKPAGTSCNSNGGTMCDGAGTCVNCVQDADCPQGAAGDCMKAVCTGGTCGFTQDDTDTPASNGNDCQTPACVSGTPTFSNNAAGTACNSNGGHVCDGTGTCLQCLQPSDCPAGNQCATATCTNNTCGVSFVANGVSCSENGGTTCDGAGRCVTHCASASDCLNSGTECGGTCQGGICVYPTNGTPCAGGTFHVCNGAGYCI